MTEHAWQPLADAGEAPGDQQHRTVVEVTVVFRYQGAHAHSTAVADAELRLAGAGPGAEIVHVYAWRPALSQPGPGDDASPPGEFASADLADPVIADGRIANALDALALGVYDGDHHKAYALDQAARHLAGTAYARWAAAHPGWAELAEGSCPP